MLLPDVSVDRRGLLAPQSAVGALKPRLVSALVVHMAVLVPLQGEAAPAFLALEGLPLVGDGLARTHPRCPRRLRIVLPGGARPILADHIRPERRQHVQP